MPDADADADADAAADAAAADADEYGHAQLDPRRDLPSLLRHLSAQRRPGDYTFATVTSLEQVPAGVEVHASVREQEGLSIVVSVEAATAHGWPVPLHAAWITFGVASALDAVGLTAAVATALAAEGISANMIAGHHHDHVLVPEDRADDALAILARWSTPPTA